MEGILSLFLIFLRKCFRTKEWVFQKWKRSLWASPKGKKSHQFKGERAICERVIVEGRWDDGTREHSQSRKKKSIVYFNLMIFVVAYETSFCTQTTSSVVDEAKKSKKDVKKFSFESSFPWMNVLSTKFVMTRSTSGEERRAHQAPWALDAS